MSWKRSRLTLCAFLFSYLILAVCAGLTQSGEIFPLFSGHWFYKTPVYFYDYGLVITQMDGKVLEQPLHMEKFYSKLSVWPFAAYGAVQRWGNSFEAQQPDQAEQALSAQKLIFGGRAYHAQLVKRQINTLEFLKDGRVVSMKVLADVQN